MRRPIIAMNFKNYINTESETTTLFKQMKQELTSLGNLDDMDVYLFPSMGSLHVARDIFEGSSISYGSQNIAPEKNGAFTGEYSIETLIDIGGDVVEIGHYERITLFNESRELINKKIKLTLEKELTPLICVGSEETILEGNAFKEYMQNQLKSYFKGIIISETDNIVLAYEPAWAIGKKEAAPVEIVHNNHRLIREVLSELMGEQVAQSIQLIYGGSVSKENAGALVASKEVDGLFIGRFGHDPKNFREISKEIIMKKRSE